MRIKGYENYEVTGNGTVIGARGGVLKTDINSCGYERVTLSRAGVPCRRFVHQLVAEAFLGKPEGKVVNHKDGDKRNNHIDNLEWVSMSENVKDGFARGRKCPQQYPAWLVQQLRVQHYCGWTIKGLAARWGLDRGTIAKYVRQ